MIGRRNFPWCLAPISDLLDVKHKVLLNRSVDAMKKKQELPSFSTMGSVDACDLSEGNVAM